MWMASISTVLVMGSYVLQKLIAPALRPVINSAIAAMDLPEAVTLLVTLCVACCGFWLFKDS